MTTRPGPPDYPAAVSPSRSGPVSCRIRPERSTFRSHPATTHDVKATQISPRKKDQEDPLNSCQYSPRPAPTPPTAPSAEGAADDPAGQDPGAPTPAAARPRGRITARWPAALSRGDRVEVRRGPSAGGTALHWKAITRNFFQRFMKERHVGCTGG